MKNLLYILLTLAWFNSSSTLADTDALRDQGSQTVDTTTTKGTTKIRDDDC